MPAVKPALLLRMPIRRTNERTAECDSIPKLYRSVFMKLSSWIIAARPRTLSLSTTPVVVGTALAWAVERQIRWPAVLAALIGSMLIQVGTNLHNDAADSKRGGDGPDRVGPLRATASGLLDGTAVNRAACGCFAAAALMGIYLVWVGGWPIFLLGVLSILSGWAYTGGPVPVAYTPLGELFVVAFFGVGRRMRHVLAMHREASASLDRRRSRRGSPDWSGIVGQQSSRRGGRCACGTTDFGHSGRPTCDELAIRRPDGGPVRAASSDRTGAPPQPCVAGSHAIAPGRHVDQPLHP